MELLSAGSWAAASAAGGFETTLDHRLDRIGGLEALSAYTASPSNPKLTVFWLGLVKYFINNYH
jgi:threonine/homoserine/homoserine lactone efflux protein